MPSTTPDLRIAAGRSSPDADAEGCVSVGDGLSIGASAAAALADSPVSACSSERRLGQTASNASGRGSRDFERNKKSRGGFFRALTAPPSTAAAAPVAPLFAPPL